LLQELRKRATAHQVRLEGEASTITVS
jgi:hypothetical protein